MDALGGAATVVSDPFATAIGQTYLVSFLYSARPGGPSTQFLSLTFGTVGTVVDSRIDTGSVNFTTSSFLFTANATSTQLAFASLDTGTVGNLIDLVDVSPVGSAVPEPASMTMLGLGVAGLFGYGARRRKVTSA